MYVADSLNRFETALYEFHWPMRKSAIRSCLYFYFWSRGCHSCFQMIWFQKKREVMKCSQNWILPQKRVLKNLIKGCWKSNKRQDLDTGQNFVRAYCKMRTSFDKITTGWPVSQAQVESVKNRLSSNILELQVPEECSVHRMTWAVSVGKMTGLQVKQDFEICLHPYLKQTYQKEKREKKNQKITFVTIMKISG